MLHFCHYYSPIEAKDTLLSLKYQRAKLETVIALYNEVFTIHVIITMCQTNSLDNNMVYSVRHAIISSLPHLFINSQSTQHSLVLQDAGALSHSQYGYREIIHHLDTTGYSPSSSKPTCMTWKTECPGTNSLQRALGNPLLSFEPFADESEKK